MPKALCTVFLFVLTVCAETVHAQYSLEPAFPNLSFVEPVDLQYASDGSGRLFVVEQEGRIRVFDNDPAVNEAPVFMDITDRVSDAGNEEGLLGLAFDPDYDLNGYFYVYYSAADPRRSVVSRFSVSAGNSDTGDAGSELIILEVDQFQPNHNGGQLRFGPDDGMLYIGLGDGGGSGDPQENGQNRQTLLGSILRIDVSGASQADPYAIPGDNPFVGNTDGYREEIFAWGLRNPWRFSFDSETFELWAGDVGQNTKEEIDIIESAKNYGWNTMEADLCFDPSVGCDMDGLELPIWSYNHDNGDRSVTGGFVYRGQALPGLVGHYIYGDFVSSRIWALEFDNGVAVNNVELIDSNIGVAAFGVDEDNELYICGFDGTVYRLDGQTTAVDAPEEGAVEVDLYPNPFETNTTFSIQFPTPGLLTLEVYDVLGRRVATIADRRVSAGEVSIEWDGREDAGSRIAPGVYIYRLQFGEAVITGGLIRL